jgi:hypothetical protein
VRRHNTVTVAQSRATEQGVELYPYLPLARKIETIRESKKGNLNHNSYLNSGSHLIGALAEVIVGEVLGLAPSLSDVIDNGFDFVLADGRTVDTKAATYYKSPDIKVPVTTTKWADLYILVSLNTDRMLGRVEGYATKEEVQRAPVKTYGTDSRYGKNFAIGRNALHPLHELLQIKGEV